MTKEELEKENAELKEKVNILDNCDRLGDMITEAYKDQLTKAKELLKGWLGDFYNPKAFYQQRAELVEQSEQFIKDSEGK